MSRTARLVSAGLVLLVGAARAQVPAIVDVGEVSQRGQRSIVTTPTVTVLDTSPDVDTQVVWYRVVWRPVVAVAGQWRPASSPPIEGPWLLTQVGEEGSGFPVRADAFVDAETREPITSHHADLAPGSAHLIQLELQWFPADGAQLVHQEVRALQVTQGPGAQPLPGPAPPPTQPAPAVPLTAATLQALQATGTGFVVAPGLVLTTARAVAGHEAVLVERGDRLQEARVHAVDLDLDLALLEHAAGATPLPFRLAPPRVGEDVRSCGALSLRPAAAAPPLFEGRISAAGPDRLVVAARENLEGGGGALVDATGRIVGVVMAGTTGGGGALEALPGPVALRWLQSRGVMVTATDGAGPGLAQVAAASTRVYVPLR